ncbi:MAG: hypothetical protein HC802_05125 [Caldilineaceae bacterium]|nr:hypothetical protein [Caldilineaceae bacterium]
MLRKDSVNAVRWESEACEAKHRLDALGTRDKAATLDPPTGELSQLLETHDDKPWAFADPLAGIAWSADTVWRGCGLAWKQGALSVRPAKGRGWRWWALIDLPFAVQVEEVTYVTLVWDGEMLHGTQPIQTDAPFQLCEKIRVRNADELDFDLHFEFVPPTDSAAGTQIFHPIFDQPR